MPLNKKVIRIISSKNNNYFVDHHFPEHEAYTLWLLEKCPTQIVFLFFFRRKKGEHPTQANFLQFFTLLHMCNYVHFLFFPRFLFHFQSLCSRFFKWNMGYIQGILSALSIKVLFSNGMEWNWTECSWVKPKGKKRNKIFFFVFASSKSIMFFTAKQEVIFLS